MLRIGFACLGLLLTSNAFAADPPPLPEGAIARLGYARMVFPKAGELFCTPDGKYLHCEGAWIDLASGAVVPSPYRAKFSNKVNGFLTNGTAVVGSPGDYRLYDRAIKDPLLTVSKDGWCAFDIDARRVVRGEFTANNLDQSVQVFTSAPFPAKGEPTGWQEMFRLDWKDLNWLYLSENGAAVTWIYGKPSKKIGYRHFATGKTWTLDPPKKADADVDLALFPDGSKLVVTVDTQLTVYDTATGKVVVSRDFGPHSGREIRINPNGRGCVVQDVWSGALYVPFDENEKVVRFENRGHGVESTVCLPDGKRVAVVDRNGVVRLYDLATGKQTDDHSPYPDWADVQVVGRNTIGCWSTTGEVLLWDTRTGRPERQMRMETTLSERNPVGRFSPDGKEFCTRLEKGHTRVYDTSTGKILLNVEDEKTGGLNVGDLTTGGRVAIPVDRSKDSSIPNGFDVYDLATGKRTHQLSTFTQARHTIAPDGRTLAAATPGRVELHELATGKERWILNAISNTEGISSTVYDLQFDSAGRQLFVFRSNDITVLDVRTGKQTAQLHLETSGPNKKRARMRAVSRSGRWVAGLVKKTDDTSELLLVDLSGEKPEEYTLTVPIPENPVYQIRLDDDARRLITCERGGVCVVWDLEAWLKPHLRPKAVVKPDVRTPWELLADNDPPVAQRGMEALYADPIAAVKEIEKQMPPAVAIPEKKLSALVDALSSPDFRTREAATKALSAVADQAEATLRASLKESSNAEQSQRLETVLDKLVSVASDPARLRQVRAVEVLERIGSPEAKKLLKDLAGGASGATLTREAADSSRRLKRD